MSTSSLRADAAKILTAALVAADPVRLVSGALVDEPELADWVPAMTAVPPSVAGADAASAPSRSRTLLVAVGKAALGMTRGALQVLGDAVDDGIVLVPHHRGPAGVEGRPPPRPAWLPPQIALRSGGHPLPDRSGRDAAGEIADLAEGAGESDRLLVLLSGGGSALLTLPRDDVPLEALRTATAHLLEAGLEIAELNRIRTLLEELKGGGLARKARRARILGLVLSDVVGDDPGVVASGPLTHRSPSPRQAEMMLRRSGVWEGLPAPVRDCIQRAARTPATGDAESSPSVREPVVRLVGGGRTALHAARARARELGYRTVVLTSGLTGEARRAGRGLARVACAVQDGVSGPSPPACLLAAGETTVEVVGSGSGGRNQEVALGAALGLEGRSGILVASLGTDGVDGPTDAAGGIADGRTVSRAREAGLDVRSSLADNDSHRVLHALGDLIRTGPTGTNVADLMLVLVSDDRSPDPS